MRRLLFIAHRWTGVVLCLFMLAWFLSGMVMLFVGYPKASPSQAVYQLPALAPAMVCDTLQQAPLPAQTLGSLRALRLSAPAGQAQYMALDEQGRQLSWPACVEDQHLRTPQMADSIAQRLFPGERKVDRGALQQDRWTHSGYLNAHRPLYRVDVLDPTGHRLYFSSRTGELLLQSTSVERFWTYFGAWTHWLYSFKRQSSDPLWDRVIILLSSVGTVLVCSGFVVGIWRWRFRQPYHSGARTPYKLWSMRWHHGSGLLFGMVLMAWISSGLVSMNPAGVFSASQGNVRQDPPAVSRFLDSPLQSPAQILAVLHEQGFSAVQLQWLSLSAWSYVLATDQQGQTRIVRGDAGMDMEVLEVWPESDLLQALSTWRDVPYTRQWLRDYDWYYFKRAEPSMYADSLRPLPVLKVSYANTDNSWLYLDPRTGLIEMQSSRQSRWSRWLFNLLHSWDTPFLLRHEWLRQLLILIFSAGGVLVCATGVVMAWRFLCKTTSR